MNRHLVIVAGLDGVNQLVNLFNRIQLIRRFFKFKTCRKFFHQF